MIFSQLANILASRLHFHFHDNSEFWPRSPSTFPPVNTFLSVQNVGQHRAHQPIRISSPQATWFFQQDLQSFWNVLHNWYSWYRGCLSKTNSILFYQLSSFYPTSMMRSLVGDYFGLKIFSICWRPSLPVCPVHCGLTRLQGPRGRRMEERRRRRRRRCRRRRWRRRLGKRRPNISTTLQTLSFPFTNCVKDKPGRGLLHKTQLIFLSRTATAAAAALPLQCTTS